MDNIELLAPAGGMEALNAAVSEGADAVYLGLKSFNARIRAGNFAYSEFDAVLRAMHKQNKKIYVAVNTVFEQREADRMYQLLKYLCASGVDGIIVQDFGVLKMCSDYFPSIKIHASTQMNVSSAKAANLLSKFGVSRCVLSRELSYEDLKEIRARTNIELEIFVHGALCVSASGLCLFSSFLGGKSANRGMCTQGCRRLYAAEDTEDSKYYFSPNDLQLIEKIPNLVKAGINSFKIEGRMKSAEYTGAVVRAYRHVIDNLDGNICSAIEAAKQMLSLDFARTKTTFLFDKQSFDWLNPDQDGGTGIKLGSIEEYCINANAENAVGTAGILIRCRVKIHIGDSIRIHRADDSMRKSYKIKHVEQKHNGITQLIVEIGSDPEVTTFPFRTGDTCYIVQTKENSRRYAQLVPKDFIHSKRKPGFDQAPPIRYTPVNKVMLKEFPAGIYVAVSNLNDMYVVQSIKPQFLIINGSIRTLEKLLAAKKAIPFKTSEIIISLDPFFPESVNSSLSGIAEKLLDAGYDHFIVNNLGHITMLQKTNATLIAGPYLYTFNRFSVSFLEKNNLQFFVTPHEFSRQNLERVFEAPRFKEPSEREAALVCVFSYPPLFRIQSNLSGFYDFSYFEDTRGESFRLATDDKGSIVYPQSPFSIIDKIPFLKQAGFKRFIIDFSGTTLKKHIYKTIIDAANKGTPIPGISRFNYKNGFFTQE
ncbi:MAG: peptidase U32 family protein [Termitinemataceae bacterium]|nr:MAG: peptidase U32 family protein [Termitinemataceae bacterium]